LHVNLSLNLFIFANSLKTTSNYGFRKSGTHFVYDKDVFLFSYFILHLNNFQVSIY